MYRRNSQALYPLVSFSAMLQGGWSNELGRKCKVLPTALPCWFQVALSQRTAQDQDCLSSGLVQSIVPHQREIIRLDRLSVLRCIISEPADWGSLRVKELIRPENKEGLDIPVARCWTWYWLSLGDEMRKARFVLYFLHKGFRRCCLLMSLCVQPLTL